jgi:hypothetical protein
MRQKIWEMRPRWKNGIVTVCLSALAVETFGTALKGNISQPLPSATQMAATVTSTSSAAPVLVASFSNAINEAVYLNVPALFLFFVARKETRRMRALAPAQCRHGDARDLEVSPGGLLQNELVQCQVRDRSPT